MVVPKDYGTPERRTSREYDQVPRSRSYQRDDSSGRDPNSQRQLHR